MLFGFLSYVTEMPKWTPFRWIELVSVFHSVFLLISVFLYLCLLSLCLLCIYLIIVTIIIRNCRTHFVVNFQIKIPQLNEMLSSLKCVQIIGGSKSLFCGRRNSPAVFLSLSVVLSLCLCLSGCLSISFSLSVFVCHLLL